MERTKTTKQPEGLQWRKLGGGSLRLNGQIIKPNQVFWAALEDVPTSFLDCLECLSPGGLQKVIKEETVIEEKDIEMASYSLKLNAAKSTDKEQLWDIVNEKGKVINEEPMSKEEAEATITALM